MKNDNHLCVCYMKLLFIIITLQLLKKQYDIIRNKMENPRVY